MKKGKIYMVPTILSDHAWYTIPAEVFDITKTLNHYFVENARTARRSLRAMHQNLVLEDILFEEVQNKTQWNKENMKSILDLGFDIGVMSEAGCSGIADPGSDIAMWAHEHGYIVKPLTGPSSILLALSASGLNGQNFAFNGYLPVDKQERIKKIKTLEQRSQIEQQTQIFIETPYRNQQLFNDLLQHCKSSTKICVAYQLTSNLEQVITKTISSWKNTPFNFEKEPAIFLMQA